MTKKKKTMPWPLFPRMSIGKDVHLSYSVFLKNPPAEKKKKKESACQCKRRGFDPWVGKIPWKRAWQPIPVFLPRIPWTEETGRLQSMGSQRLGHDRSNLACVHVFLNNPSCYINFMPSCFSSTHYCMS